MLINGIRQPLPRSGPKKKEYQCIRQNATWTLEFFLDKYLMWRAEELPMSLHPAEDVCMPKRWDGKSVNKLFIKAANNQSPRADTEAKTLAVQMVGFRTTREEIQGIYNEVYQQEVTRPPTVWARADGGPWLGNLHFLGRMDVQRWDSTRPEEDLGGATASILQPCCQTESHHWIWVRNEDSHHQALNGAREAHQRALEAIHLLEQNIERLSWQPATQNLPNAGAPIAAAAPGGRPQERHAQSLSPHRLQKHVTFLDQEEETSSGKGPLREHQGRWLEEERWRRVTWASTHLRARDGVLPRNTNNACGTRDRCGSLPEPLINNYEMWLEWQVHQLDTPTDERVDCHTECRWSWKVGSENVCLLWSSTNQMWDPQEP